MLPITFRSHYSVIATWYSCNIKFTAEYNQLRRIASNNSPHGFNINRQPLPDLRRTPFKYFLLQDIVKLCWFCLLHLRFKRGVRRKKLSNSDKKYLRKQVQCGSKHCKVPIKGCGARISKIGTSSLYRQKSVMGHRERR